jgi:hypothetical protein
MRSRGAFGPEAIAEVSAVLDAAFEEHQDTGEPVVVRERIATRIIAAARLGSVRLLQAAVLKYDKNSRIRTRHFLFHIVVTGLSKTRSTVLSAAVCSAVRLEVV